MTRAVQTTPTCTLVFILSTARCRIKIAINGTGVAGPTLAWWLRRYGHQPVLFEKAPTLRTSGYVIDFWGVGYDVAEKMGLLPALYDQGYIFRSLRMVDRLGRTVASLDVSGFRALINDRFLSIAHGDIASTIYQACEGVDSRFGNSIVGIRQRSEGVIVQASDGTEEEFDLVVGADGLHSSIRSLVFGCDYQFEKPMGFYVAAFALPHYEHRDELIYVSHTIPLRQVVRVALRDDYTLFLFILRAELLASQPATASEQKAALHGIFGSMEWEVPQIMARMDEVEEMYFDRVSQIHMDRWANGRVALVGDAAACVSLLAGEGTGLAMTEAYVLAGELHRARGDYTMAFQKYEKKLRSFLARKQNAAVGFASFFAPRNSLGLLCATSRSTHQGFRILAVW